MRFTCVSTEKPNKKNNVTSAEATSKYLWNLNGSFYTYLLFGTLRFILMTFRPNVTVGRSKSEHFVL